MAFKKPNQVTIERMTVGSLTSLLGALKDRRKVMTKEIDEEIAYYEDLLKKKQNAQAAS